MAFSFTSISKKHFPYWTKIIFIHEMSGEDTRQEGACIFNNLPKFMNIFYLNKVEKYKRNYKKNM